MSDIVQGAPRARQFKGFFGWLLLPLFLVLFGLVMGLTALPGIIEVYRLLPQKPPTEVAFWLYMSVSTVLLTPVAPVMLLILFFRRQRAFPTWFGVWFALGAAQAVIGGLLLWALYQVHPINQNVLGPLIAQASVALLWLLALRRSERLRNTFVN